MVNQSVILNVLYRTLPANFCNIPKPALPMVESKRQQEEKELAAYTARWLELADAALSATDKAAKALEIAREEQDHMRTEIKRTMERYSKNIGEAKKRS
jgi:hypothetical protein